MYCTTLGFLSGLDQACFKFVGLALVAGEPIGSTFVLGLGFLGFVGACLQMTLINIGIKLYKQVDFGPIYESSANIMTVVTGLVLFNEAELYDKK